MARENRGELSGRLLELMAELASYDPSAPRRILSDLEQILEGKISEMEKIRNVVGK